MMMKIKKIYTVVAVIAIACFSAQEAGAQRLAVKTNALYWAAMTPNIGFEGVVGEKLSVDLSFVGHHRPYGFDSSLIACQPELRFWFGGRPLVREFIGFTMAAAVYDLTLRGTVHDGYSLMAGITAGYAFNIGKRWNLELSGAVGVAGFAEQRFGANDNYVHYGKTESGRLNSFGYKLMPFELGITFSYIIM